MIASFDGPDTDFSCPVRFQTTQPTQALELLNSDFMREQGAVFADYLRREVGSDRSEQVHRTLTRVLQREPSAQELAWGRDLLNVLHDTHRLAPELALRQFCVTMLNLNEFVYLD